MPHREAPSHRAAPEGGPPAGEGVAAEPVRAPRVVLAILLAGGITYSLSQTLILPALPALAERLGASQADASWLLTSYLLAAAVATPLVGKLGDLHGRGRMLAVVAAVFCVGSVMCVTNSFALAIAGRVLQGVAGGVFPLAYGVIRDTFPRRRVMTAIGALSVSLGVGAGLGPAVAGVVADAAGPASVFWVGILCALPALAAPWVIRESRPAVRPRLDLLGVAVLSAALVSMLLGLTQGGDWGWGSPLVLSLLAAGVLLLVVWVRVEHGHAEPLIAIDVLRDRTVALTNATAVCVGFGTFVTYTSIAPFAQMPESTGYGLGMSVPESGLLLLPHGLVMMLLAPLAGLACQRYGSRPVLIGGTTCSALASGLIVLEHDAAVWLLLGAGALGGAHAFSLAALANLIVAAVPQRDVGIATGMSMVTRTIGMAVGAAASAAVLAASAGPLPSEGGYVLAFGLAAAASAVAVACALAISGRTRLMGAVPATARGAPS